MQKSILESVDVETSALVLVSLVALVLVRVVPNCPANPNSESEVEKKKFVIVFLLRMLPLLIQMSAISHLSYTLYRSAVVWNWNNSNQFYVLRWIKCWNAWEKNKLKNGKSSLCFCLSYHVLWNLIL